MSQSERRNLAFYKKSGEPWTKDEYLKICEYCGDVNTTGFSIPSITEAYIFDNGDRTGFMYFWSSPQSRKALPKCTKVAYEDTIEQIIDISNVEYKELTK